MNKNSYSYSFNPKKTGRGRQIDSPCDFSKYVFFRVKPCFFVTFNIIISRSEDMKFFSLIITIFIDFLDFLKFACYKETVTSL